MADEIVIGTSLPKTGPYAETQFLQYQRSYDQWVADVNASGGILGKQVKFVVGVAGVNNEHLHILSSIAKVFTNKAQVAQLEAATSVEEVLELFGKVNA